MTTTPSSLNLENQQDSSTPSGDYFVSNVFDHNAFNKVFKSIKKSI